MALPIADRTCLAEGFNDFTTMEEPSLLVAVKLPRCCDRTGTGFWGRQTLE